MITTLRKAPDCAFGVVDDLFICLWRESQPTLESAEKCGELVKQHQQTRQGPIGLVTIVPENSPTPDGAVRKRIADVLSASTNVKGSAVCFEGTGLRATIVRTIVTGITLMARLSFPHQVFASALAGTAFVVACLRDARVESRDARELAGEIEAWRKSL